ncbi:MAG: LamG domain-containing protein, partial [Candidatus Cloacimonadaceae bacterium]|nr:LamG domain-containing protein [Candidatus Cloacimonadaceae bacterium]
MNTLIKLSRSRMVLVLVLLLVSVFCAAVPYRPDTPSWNVLTDVISFRINADSFEPVTGFAAVLYNGSNSVVSTYSETGLNLTENTDYIHDFHAAMVGHSANTRYYVVVSATNSGGTTASDPSGNNVKGLASLQIGGLLDFGTNPDNIIFSSTGNHTPFVYGTATTLYNHTLRHEVEALSLTFPAEGQYRLSGTYHGSPDEAIFTQDMVTGSHTVYLKEAQSSSGRDANGNPNGNDENNVLTIVVNPGNTDFEKTYTLRLRRRLYCPIASLANITHTGYAFSCTILGDDSGSPQPSVVNGDTIPTVQSIRWSVLPITGTAYFSGNQMYPLSSGDIKVRAASQNGVSVSLDSSVYTISGQSNYQPHLAILELRNAKTADGDPLNFAQAFSSDPSASGIYNTSIAEDFSAIRLSTWAPADCRLYLNGALISNHSSTVLRMEPTTPNGNPAENIYTLRVENSQGYKDYSIRIQRGIVQRLRFGRVDANPPHLAAATTGDIFGMNNATVKDKFTIQAWVRWTSDPATADQWANIATLTDSQDSGSFWLQHNRENSRFEFAFSTVNNRRFINSTTIPQQGVWYHLTGVYDGAYVNIYVNGNWEGRISNSGNFRFVSGTTEFNIGKIPKSTRRFPGNIRDVRIWVGTARTAGQIASDYAGTTVNDSNFSWPLNETTVGSVATATATGNVTMNMTNITSNDFISCCQNNMAQGQAFLLRPTRMDLNSADSESAILVY